MVRQAEDERRRQESTVSARETILDASASIEDKTQAWRRLRSGGWTDAVVQGIVRLAQSSTDPAFRADVCGRPMPGSATCCSCRR